MSHSTQNQASPQTSTAEIFEKAKFLAESNSQTVLTAIGFDVGAYGNIKCACPIHNGDNQHGFSWNERKKVWHCWTKKCHETHGSDIIGLIAGIKRFSRVDAVKYIFTLFDPSSLDIFEIKAKSYVNQKLLGQQRLTPIKWDLGRYTVDQQYMPKRGLSSQVIKDYKINICQNVYHPLYNRSCIPIYDETNTLVGFTGRYIKPIACVPKWKHYPLTFQSRLSLFNINNAQHALRETKIAICVESPLDLLNFVQNGVTNVVCPLGTYISEEQVKILVKNGVETLIIVFDPDDGGRVGSSWVTDKCSKFFHIKNIQVDKKPSEMSKEEIEACLK